MLISMHYSVNNHHATRSVLEEASLKTETNLSSKQCVIIQHTCWKKAKVYDFSHGTTGQKLYKTNHSEQRQCCGGEINLQCTIFQVIFTTHLPIDIKCLQEMMFHSFPMEHSMHIKTNISKHFTQEQTSLPTSGREIPCCHL